ncbi:hypothetical protein LXA43DRAFT_380256 [Ganoderma leucocontextum]|nr:hypothetical protein LXA43DRAFT_380256 [Ganoderma leucocontextum]
MLQYIPWAVFAAKRAFALSSKNLPFTTLILVLSLVPIGAAISHFVFGLDGQSDPTFGCVVVDPIDPVLSQRCAYPFLQVHIIPRFHLTVCLVTVISRACLIVADALLVLATWVTVSRTVRMGIFTTGDMPTFGAVLLRNGALYFLVLFFLNSLHLTLTVLSVSEIAFQNASFVLQFVHPITGILVSHFLLDLQSTNRAVMHMDTISTQQADTIIFDRAVFTLENATSYESFKDAGSHMSKSMDLNDRSSVYSVRGLDPVAEGSDQESRIPRWKVLVV